MKKYIKESIKQNSHVIDSMSEDGSFLIAVEHAAQICIDALQNGKKILLIGNGGSAADCQHIAGELVSRFMFDRAGLPAIALTTDTSILTAIGNDYGYEKLFERQVQTHGEAGDVLIAYSTSGKSVNIIKAVAKARESNISTIVLTGNKETELSGGCDCLISVPSSETPRIQEGHLLIGHTICGLIEQKMFGNEI